MRKSILIAILFALCFVSAQDVIAQRRNPAKNADIAFERKQYYSAIEKYKKAYKKTGKKKYKDERIRITYQLGECYRLTESYRLAAAQYKRVVKSEFPKEHPEVYLYYGDVLKSEEKYEDALYYYNLYSEAVPDDPRGQRAAEDIQYIQEWMEYPSKYEVTRMKNLNSRSSDFGVAWTSNNFNEIIFSSSREGGVTKEKDVITGQHFADFYTVRQDKNGEWGEVNLADDADIINSEGSEGTPFINKAFNTMYFTRCPNHKNRESGCQIMKSSRSGSSWGDPVTVTIANIDSLDVIGHPTLTDDELIMYFAADRKGGFGGKDIWVTTREDKGSDFSRPFNLGPVVNTAGDEMFPFLRNDSTLYFSSNGHGGMGGLDIFVTTIDSTGNWGMPKNLRSPINSIGNDFAIVFHPTEERGFFASNRDSRNGLDDDIYYFIEPPIMFTVTGNIKDLNTLQYVEGANVRLSTAEDGVVASTLSSESGNFLFTNNQVFLNKLYILTIDKDNYFTLTDTINTIGLEFSRDFTKDYDLSPIPDQPVVLPDILYDLAKWDLKPQFEDSLQSLIETLQINPTITIELGSHTDNRDSEERNDILSQKRAQSVVDYLILRGIDPLRLTAKGYGERVPRTLQKDYVIDGYTFKTGTVLTEEFINSLESNNLKEAAHQLNRRTEFRVLSKDYVPRTNISDNQTAHIRLRPEDNKIDFVQDTRGNFSFNAIVNAYTERITYDQSFDFGVSQIKAMAMLKDGIITKNDFKGDDIDKIITAGAIKNLSVFVIKEMRIADKTLYNVEVTVYNNLLYDWVIGQKVLKKFGNFEFDINTMKLIFK